MHFCVHFVIELIFSHVTSEGPIGIDFAPVQKTEKSI